MASHPWVWCYNASSWLYISDQVAEAGVGWIYIPGLTLNTPALWIVMEAGTDYGYSYGLGKWLYVHPGGSGWVYLL